MPEEVIEFLRCTSGGVYVDGTLGGGGHTALMLEASKPDGKVIGLDIDGEAIAEAEKFLESFGSRAVVVRESYRDVEAVLGRLGVDGIDGMVLDLGASSFQLERAARGFSFMQDGALDMRMDTRKGVSAETVVAEFAQGELENVIRTCGEERRARSIARAIVKARETTPIKTTTQLAKIITSCFPPSERYGKLHPATRTFQALRILVNDELENIKAGLKAAIRVLNCGARLVVISFHSLEDRLVKQAFVEASRGCVCPRDFPQCICNPAPLVKRITRKVVLATSAEIDVNARSRSAKLRVIEKI
jgi:16S rRNA (cytosine1402-N4)-methyltransferase